GGRVPQLLGSPLGEGERLGPHRAEPQFRGVRHPTITPRGQDGLPRRRLADQPRHTNLLGPQLHQGPLWHPVCCVVPLGVGGLVLGVRTTEVGDTGCPRPSPKPSENTSPGPQDRKVAPRSRTAGPLPFVTAPLRKSTKDAG